MKSSRGIRTKVLFVLLAIVLILSTVLHASATEKPGGHTLWSGISDWIKGGVIEAVRDFFVKYFTLSGALRWNPQIYPLESGSVFSGIIKLVLQMLIPFYSIMLIVNGIMFVWSSENPAIRAQTKERIMKLTIGMVACSMAPVIFQTMLEIELLMVGMVLDQVAGSGAQAVVLLLGAIVWFIIPAAIPVLLVALFFMIAPFLILAVRYIIVQLLAALFPITIFLYSIDYTKNIGAKLVRISVMWTFMPLVIAFIYAITIGALSTMSFSNIGGSIANAGIALAGLFLMTITPMLMTSMMNTVGGFVSHIGRTSGNYTWILAGNLMEGRAPHALTDTAALMGRHMTSGELGQGLVDKPLRDVLRAGMAGQQSKKNFMDFMNPTKKFEKEDADNAKKAEDLATECEKRASKATDPAVARHHRDRASKLRSEAKKLRTFGRRGEHSDKEKWSILQKMRGQYEDAEKRGDTAAMKKFAAKAWTHKRSPTRFIAPMTGQVLKFASINLLPKQFAAPVDKLGHYLAGGWEEDKKTGRLVWVDGQRGLAGMGRDLFKAVAKNPLKTAGATMIGIALFTPVGAGASLIFGGAAAALGTATIGKATGWGKTKQESFEGRKNEIKRLDALVKKWKNTEKMDAQVKNLRSAGKTDEALKLEKAVNRNKASLRHELTLFKPIEAVPTAGTRGRYGEAIHNYVGVHFRGGLGQVMTDLEKRQNQLKQDNKKIETELRPGMMKDVNSTDTALLNNALMTDTALTEADTALTKIPTGPAGGYFSNISGRMDARIGEEMTVVSKQVEKEEAEKDPGDRLSDLQKKSLIRTKAKQNVYSEVSHDVDSCMEDMENWADLRRRQEQEPLGEREFSELNNLNKTLQSRFGLTEEELDKNFGNVYSSLKNVRDTSETSAASAGALYSLEKDYFGTYGLGPTSDDSLTPAEKKTIEDKWAGGPDSKELDDPLSDAELRKIMDKWAGGP